MKVVLFYQSILSCWNHGNVHFLRGIARELIQSGHQVAVYEPEDGWSRTNALADGGIDVFAETALLTPGITIHTYRHDTLDLDQATDDADLVIVHEWNSPALVAAIGRQRIAGATYTLLFHDTHHRAVTAPAELDRLDIEGYDAVLAFGEVLRQIYLKRGWARRAFTWHEAADTALFHPLPSFGKDVDLIWIGNWGDDERSRELETFLINPAARLNLRTRVHGVRYPKHARDLLAARGIEYAGWIPNHRAPRAFSRARVTAHVPRCPYAAALPGIPTIRVFEALACGIPLVCSPWSDEEQLFPADCYLMANDENGMTRAISSVLSDHDLAWRLVESGLNAIRARHTCAHRVLALLSIVESLKHKHRPVQGEPAEPERQAVMS
jgi:spore maturation protein CgeB